MHIQNLELQTSADKILDKLIEELKKRNSNLFSLGYRESGDYLMVQCPYHKFGQERHPSAEFRKADGFFYCFNCKAKYPLPRVISDLLNTNGKAWLLENFDGVATEDRDVDFEVPDRTVEQKTYLDNKVLDQYRKKHPYMYKRKLTDKVIEKFDIGYDPDFTLTKNGKEFKFGECITFPVRDEFGNLLFIARRAINQKLFHYPEGAEKPLFGLYEIYQEIKAGKNITDVYICESMINALTLWGWGKYAIALNGTGNKEQLEALKKTPFKEFILALDPDPAGRKGTEKLRNELEKHKIISELEVPEGKDINDLTYEEFTKLNVKDDFWF